ncbi:MAG TPA: glycosyltransferase family 2 protein [Acetobacteraceae bacterium]|jgi:glycosyltransferase involved in cell wall biosynthesis|nr:glycosyltransferase family 2 protein [Acetobacteraceae bacterium]
MSLQLIDIICPVFREERGIMAFHDRLVAVLDVLAGSYAFHIIYVVDPAGDRTEEVLAAIAARDRRVEVLVMSRRFGHQTCLMAGLDLSRGAAAIMLDSDQQHPPELIPVLLRNWEEGVEIVQTIRGETSETGLLKRLTSRWFYQLYRRLGSMDLPVGAADFRLLGQPVVQLFRTKLREQNPFLRGLVHWVGFNIRYVAFEPEARPFGRSAYRPLTLLKFALNGWCSFSKTPLRICVITGLALAVLAAIATVLQVFVYMSGHADVPGWLTLIVVTTFLGGVQLVFLGVIGEYVGLIFDEVKARPRYIVQQHYHSRDVPATAERTKGPSDESVGVHTL